MVDALRGEESIHGLCRREGIAESHYSSRSKEFFEAVKRRPSGDTQFQASTGEVQGLKREMRVLKGLVAERLLENCLLKNT